MNIMKKKKKKPSGKLTFSRASVKRGFRSNAFITVWGEAETKIYCKVNFIWMNVQVKTSKFDMS